MLRSPTIRPRIVLALTILVASTQAVRGDDAEPDEPPSIEDSLPYGSPPIDYHAAVPKNVVATLDERVRGGTTTLRHEPVTGYLRSVLDELDVPVASQMLVFSKTALNVQRIKPSTPRAVYFNDDVYVGWVPGTRAVEISVDDPKLGGVFYTLSQDPEREPRFEREKRCLACHAGGTTLKVPGHLARSFLVDDRGRPQTGYSRVTHAFPLAKRFGGWYVTGDFGDATHMGNLRNPAEAARRETEPTFRTSLDDLSDLVDLSAYPSTHSDAVAHLVLHHQLHGRNLITRVAYEARLDRRSDAEDQLLRYLFFVDEPELEAPVSGTTDYRRWFEARGRRDEAGRSLRTLNLRTRLFEHRLSYLVHSNSFNALPKDVLARMWRRIDGVLGGENPDPEYARIPMTERRTIRSILDSTRDDSAGDR